MKKNNKIDNNSDKNNSINNNINNNENKNNNEGSTGKKVMTLHCHQLQKELYSHLERHDNKIKQFFTNTITEL